MLLRRAPRRAGPRMMLAISAMLAGLAAVRATNAAPDTAPPLELFLAAPSREAAAHLIDRVVKSGVGFDAASRALQRGRRYGPAPTGVVRLRNKTSDDVEHHYVLNVPDGYDPARRYQVRFQLHGGVGGRESNAPVGTGTIGALAGAEQIYVIPYAWNDAPWWSDDQVLNLVEILDATKRTYNVDENRVVVSGVSDGGTGAYWVAMRETTPFASFLPLNGYWMVLASGDIDDGMLFANNLRNKPIFAVNGGRDRLYPTAIVDPYIAHMKRGGVSVDYHPQPEAGHNTSWWPEVKDTFEAFAREHPRAPLPDTLTWETGRTNGGNRAHWLIIDTLGAQPGDAASIADLNDMAMPPAPDFGVRTVGSHVNRVMPGSNAEKVGLKAGDGIVRLNDKPIPSGLDLADALEEIAPGSAIALLVARNNEPVELSGTYDPQVAPVPPRHLFARGAPPGRVDLTRAANTVTAVTRGVAGFTLLLSPAQFDLAKPVKVVVNGRTAFEGKVEKSLATLLKYAAVDNDRTMLFGAELHIDLARPR
jgi:membrane-associated protease RseP (regulator of RpoE activity)